MWRPNSNKPESSNWSRSVTLSQQNPTLSFYGPACIPDFLNSSKPLPQLTACVYSSLISHTHGPQKVLFACPIKYPLNFPKVAHIIKITIKKKPFQQQRSLVFYLILVVAKAVRIKSPV